MSNDAPMTSAGERLFVSTRDYETEVVIPALGDQAGDYDTHSIAADMLTHHEEQDGEGWAQGEHTGLRERDDVDFWDVVAEHDVLGQVTAATQRVREVEALLDEVRAAELAAVLRAHDAGHTKYRIAQASGRSEVSVGRWVNQNRPHAR